MTIRRKEAALGVFWAAVLLGHALAAPLYRVTDLGTLGGALSRAHAVSEHGHVAGESETARGDLRAFLWTPDSGMTDLGSLGGAASRAYDINDKDVVVGEAETAAGLSRPFRWRADHGLTALGLPADCSAGYAQGLNHFGVIVGAGDTPEGSRALIWTVDDIRPLAASNALSVAHDVNDEGWVAGQMDEEGGVSGFLLFSDSTNAGLVRVRSGEFAGCAVLAVNATGGAAGYAVSPEGRTVAAVMAADGSVESIDRLDSAYSIANGINASGHVVGSFIAADGEDEHAFLYREGEFHDLNDLIEEVDDWVLVEARDVNDRGEIVGYGLRNGEERAVLLTPDLARAAELPSVRIVEPEAWTAYDEKAAIRIRAEAAAPRGVKRVVFYVNGQAIGACGGEPFEWTWEDAPAGENDLLAVATDRDGRVRRSARVRVTVGAFEPLEPDAGGAAPPGADAMDVFPTAEPPGIPGER